MKYLPDHAMFRMPAMTLEMLEVIDSYHPTGCPLHVLEELFPSKFRRKSYLRMLVRLNKIAIVNNRVYRVREGGGV